MEPKEVPGACLFNARLFMPEWFKYRGMTLAKLRSTTNWLPILRLDYEDMLQAFKFQSKKKVKGLDFKQLEAAFIERSVIFEKEYRAKLLKELDCEKENLKPLKEFVLAVTGKQDELDIAVLAHWLWQVKRRSNALNSNWPIMPVFKGEQGGGKSYAVRALLEPYAEFTVTPKLDKLSDERYYHSLSENYVAFFDELQGAERADLNALKNQITTPTNTYRELYTKISKTVPMVASFIGATNKPLAESLTDSTGMRRFYEVQCLATLDWTLINNFDYRAIWLGIDERKNEGYMTHEILKKLNLVQQALVHKEEVELFIEEMGLFPTEEECKSISTKTLYQHYRDWAMSEGLTRPLSCSWFTRKLTGRGFVVLKTRDENDKIQSAAKINAKCMIATAPALVTKTLQFKKEI